MTLEQELEIQELLENWRDERHLSIESQRDGLMGNLCEEMAEYYRATNESEKIDALCDICVFCINSLEDIDIKAFRENFSERIINSNLFTSTKLTTLYLVDSALKDDIVLDRNKQIYKMIKVCEREIKEMGYDFYKCMMETIKEISSRTGHYDENIHKFVKDKSDEAKSKWYKADYESCKDIWREYKDFERYATLQDEVIKVE